MPTTRPGFIWSGTEWVAIGQEAVVNPFYYQATAPTGAATGAIWIESDVDVPSIDSSQFLRWRKTMTGGETSLSGNDDSSLPLAYTPGYEQLYINGVLQVRGQDYTATTGTTVTGLTALVANDVVEIFSAVARTVADVYTQTQSDARFVNRNVGGLNLVVPPTVSVGSGSYSLTNNGQITFTGASSISINNCFTSLHDSYQLVLLCKNNSANDTAINMQFRNAGSNIGGTAYSTNKIQSYLTVVSASGTNSTSSWNLGSVSQINYSQTECTISNPALALPKTQSYRNAHGQSGGTLDTYYGFGINTTATAYDGLHLTVGSGTITGTIRIYGYNNGA
jgi:hypothetical protein